MFDAKIARQLAEERKAVLDKEAAIREEEKKIQEEKAAKKEMKIRQDTLVQLLQVFKIE